MRKHNLYLPSVDTLSPVISTIVGLVILIGLGACAPSPSVLKKVIEDNPEIVFAAIEKNPKQFIEVVNKAAREAQSSAREEERIAEEKRFEEEFANPKKPNIEGRTVFGPKVAPITIVEYSDFECPYCTQGYQNLKMVRKEFGDKVRVVYKHLPLDIHPLALPAAKYFQAIAIQDGGKAEKFHDMIFENQEEFRAEKEGFLKKAAKKVGADMAKLAKDVESDAVKKVIADDMAEAKQFGFSGTPGFLVEGISIRGAYPPSEFKKIIDRHMANKGGK